MVCAPLWAKTGTRLDQPVDPLPTPALDVADWPMELSNSAAVSSMSRGSHSTQEAPGLGHRQEFVESGGN